MNTFSQGTENWKQVTKGMTICAYNPILISLGGAPSVVVPGLPVDHAESDWPYVRTRTNPEASRVLRSFVVARTLTCA
jgi:hypothetical protein